MIRQVPPNAQLTHVGLYVADLETMIAFYTGVLGLAVSDRGTFAGRGIAFLTRNPAEHHQLVLAEGGRPEAASRINQISFRVDSLEDLRRYYACLRERQVPVQGAHNHGNAWSVYFFDPEGNRLELYAGSPWHVSQPFAQPLDLTQPADAILRETEALIGNNPTRRPAGEWSAELAGRLG